VGLQGTNCLRGTTKAGDDDDDDDDAVWMAAVMCGRRNGGGGWRVNVGVRAAQRSTSTYSGTQLDKPEEGRGEPFQYHALGVKPFRIPLTEKYAIEKVKPLHGTITLFGHH